MSLVRSNLGFLRSLTFLMRTFWSGKTFEHSFWICLPMSSLTLYIINIKLRIVQFPGQLFQSRLLNLVAHNFHHLLTNCLDLWALSIASSLDLFRGPLCEPNGEDSEHVSIRGFSLNESFNESVPFLNQSAELVSGDVHSVEVGVAIHSFYFFNLEFHPSVGFLMATLI